MSAGRSSGEGCDAFDSVLLVLYIEGSLDLSPRLTQTVLEVCYLCVPKKYRNKGGYSASPGTLHCTN